MARTASTPLPEIMTSPLLGNMIAAQLDQQADQLSKDRAQLDGVELVDSTLVQALRSTARQLRDYHSRAIGSLGQS